MFNVKSFHKIFPFSASDSNMVTKEQTEGYANIWKSRVTCKWHSGRHIHFFLRFPHEIEPFCFIFRRTIILSPFTSVQQPLSTVVNISFDLWRVCTYCTFLFCCCFIFTCRASPFTVIMYITNLQRESIFLTSRASCYSKSSAVIGTLYMVTVFQVWQFTGVYLKHEHLHIGNT